MNPALWLPRSAPAPRTSQGPLGNMGFALPAILIVLTFLFVITVPTIVAVQQEWQVTEAVVENAQVTEEAEEITLDLLAAWDTSFFALPVWQDSIFQETTAAATVDYRVTRTSETLFLIEAIAESTSGGATYASALTVRAGAAAVAPTATLTMLSGGVTAAVVRGTDQPVPLWTCSSTQEQSPGVVAPDAASFTLGPGGTVYGYPAIHYDAGLDASSIVQPADLHFKILASHADKTLAGGFDAVTNPVQSESTCVTSDAFNWGDANDPLDPCGDYYPIVWVQGDAVLRPGSEAQGILLVEGNLRFTGNMRFYGIAIVLGELEITGAGNDVRGSFVANSANIHDTGDGNAIVYSSCAVNRVEAAHPELANVVRPVSSRSWVDLSGTSPSWTDSGTGWGNAGGTG